LFPHQTKTETRGKSALDFSSNRRFTRNQYKSGIGDFTITSPPYWDLEQYGDEPEQLGVGKMYDDFLRGLSAVARENFRCLKAGTFCVWCVNDFRKGGRFYSYHEDTCDVLRAAGFVQHDIAITDLGPSMRAAFASQVIETKIIPKRHEYCLVFSKPEEPNVRDERRG
jgi:DNA modification methylase